ncbi:anti-sigma-I factor RsgI family protein [Melghirimyces algeriensis]|uniref:Anti-sigma factor N-terminus n=1 Tax=Melghirimyces algeriensis TaxID=910412 RepID=A0A521DIV6_9BACL|nr:anti-sigma factor domain-containing protein [Melghirimyces algeriensis]SMO70850.1 Anti-sigma factor N-terminus [Melghirimyces algeriensis]
MNKGILMKVGKRHWIVMTSDGEFLKIPSQGTDGRLGEEITFTVDRGQEFFARFSRHPRMAVSFAVVILLIGLIAPLLKPVDVNAQTYLYIDINTYHSLTGSSVKVSANHRKDRSSSLEVGVNKEGRVISVKGINQSGKALVQRVDRNLDFEGSHIDEFVTDVLIEAKKAKLLNPQDGIIVSQVPKVSDRMILNHEEELEGTLKSIKEKVKEEPNLKDTQLDTVTLPIPDSVQDRAKQHKVSPTKYALWLLSQSKGHQVDISQIPGKSTHEMMNLLSGSHTPQNPPEENEWVRWMNEFDSGLNTVTEDQQKKTESKEGQKPSGQGSEEEMDGSENGDTLDEGDAKEGSNPEDSESKSSTDETEGDHSSNTQDSQTNNPSSTGEHTDPNESESSSGDQTGGIE